MDRQKEHLVVETEHGTLMMHLQPKTLKETSKKPLGENMGKRNFNPQNLLDRLELLSKITRIVFFITFFVAGLVATAFLLRAFDSGFRGVFIILIALLFGCFGYFIAGLFTIVIDWLYHVLIILCDNKGNVADVSNNDGATIS